MIGAPQLVRPRRNRAVLAGGIPRIDWSNPRTDGLLACYVPGCGWLGDIAGIDGSGQGPVLAPFASTSQLAVGPEGQGDLSNAASMGRMAALPPSLQVTGTPLSLFWHGTVLGTQGDNTLLFGASYDDAAGSPVVAWGVYAEAGLLNDYGNSHNSITSSQVPTGRGSVSGSIASGLQSLYVNGQLATTGSNTGTFSYGTLPQLCLNGLTATYDTRYTNTIGLVMGLWGRVLSAAEHLANHLDPFGFLIFPEDRVMAQLVGAAGSGTAVAAGFSFPSEFLLSARRGLSTQSEFAARQGANPIAPLEFAAAQRATPVAPAESRLRLIGQGGLPDEWSGAVLVAVPAVVPAEWQTSLAGITGLPGESAGMISPGLALRDEALAGITAGRALGVELLRTAGADAGIPAEILARLPGAAATQVEWLSSAIAVIALGRAGVEWLRTIAAGARMPDEGAAGAVVVELAPIEWTSGVTAVAFDSALPLEWLVTAPATLAATLLATAAARLRMATAAQRLRIVTLLPAVGMSQARDLSPPQDALVEGERVGFDFGPALGPGVGITAISSIACAVYSGSDFTPAAHILGEPQIVASAATGAAGAQVNQLFGGMLASVTYRLQCVVQTSDGQTLSLWTHLPSRAPN